MRPELIPGSGGVFEVALDGDPVFSRHEQGRFPLDGEVEDLLRRHLGG